MTKNRSGVVQYWLKDQYIGLSRSLVASYPGPPTQLFFAIVEKLWQAKVSEVWEVSSLILFYSLMSVDVELCNPSNFNAILLPNDGSYDVGEPSTSNP